MAYANHEDMIARYRKFGADGDATSINSSWISPAERELDGRLSPSFTVPFSGKPPAITALTLDLAYMHWLLPRDPDKAEALREAIDAQIQRMLEGAEDIILEDGTVLDAGDSGSVYHTQAGFKLVFDLRDPEDQRIDPDRLENEDDLDDA